MQQLKAFEELDKLGIFSIAVSNPGIDCRTASGRTARRDELSRAEDFSDQNSEKTAARMKAAWLDGRCCRPAPVGYRNVGTKIKGQPNVIPDDATAPLVVKAFEMVATGNYKTTEVLRLVTEMGLRSRKGNCLKPTAFLKMLRNVFYIGLSQSKKYRQIVQGKHQAIVDERTFENVQLILKGKKPITAPYTRNRAEFPLRQFLRCSECDTPLTGSPSRGENGTRYDYYRCYKCKAVKSLPTGKAAKEFKELLSRLRPDARFLQEFPTILRLEWNKRNGENAARVRNLKLALQEEQTRKDKLFAAYLDGDKNVKREYERWKPEV